MADRKKVIKGLECCFTNMDRSDSMPCRSCPYGTLPKKQNCQKVMFADILAMMKDQEPKQVLSVADSVAEMEAGYCPSCLRGIANKKSNPTKFCRYCGQEVQWK